jgi:NTE family protein
LSGGGAKGFSQIGVLKVFIKEGIPIDYIAGTSMGGLIAALYATGYTVEQMEELALSCDWNELMTDRLDRMESSLLQQRKNDSFFLNLQIANRKIYLPKSLSYGQEILFILNYLFFSALKTHDFNKFKIPFFCIATDLSNGEQVILDKGNIVEAIRSTISIPTVLTPFELNQKLLIDGGVVNNFPVIEMKNKFNPDYVVGVDVGAPLYEKNKIDNIFKIIDQNLSFFGNKKHTENIKAVDFLITPNLSELTFFSFSNKKDIQELIRLGEEEAYKMIPEIKKKLGKENISPALITIPKAKKEDLQRNVFEPVPDSTQEKIQFKQVVFDTDFFPNTVKRRIKNQVIKNYNTSVGLSKVMRHIYSTDLFDNVYYTAEEDDLGDLNLKINAHATKLADINFGVHYDTEEDLAVLFDLNYKYWLFRFKFAIRLAKNLQVQNQFYFDHYNFFWGIKNEFNYISGSWQPYIINSSTQNIVNNTTILIEDRYSNLVDFSTGIFFSVRPNFPLKINIGLNYSHSQIRQDFLEKQFINTPIGSVIENKTNKMLYFNLLYPYFQFYLDNQNNAYFPMQGTFLSFRIEKPMRLSSGKDFETDFKKNYTAYLKLKFSIPLVTNILSFNNTLSFALNNQELIDEIPYYQVFLGGPWDINYKNFLPFQSIRINDKLTKKDGLVLGSEFLIHFYKRSFFSVFTQWALLSDDIFNFFIAQPQSMSNDIVGNFGISLGYDSFLGPAKAVGYIDPKTKKIYFYLTFGFWF